MIDWTIIKILAWTESYFTQHCIDSPRLTAEILLGFSLGIQRLDLYLQHNRPLEKKELAQYRALIKRRIAREPVAYITGEKGFYAFRLKNKQLILFDKKILPRKYFAPGGQSINSQELFQRHFVSLGNFKRAVPPFYPVGFHAVFRRGLGFYAGYFQDLSDVKV